MMCVAKATSLLVRSWMHNNRILLALISAGGTWQFPRKGTADVT